MGRFIKLVILRTLIVHSFTLFADDNFDDFQAIVAEIKTLEQNHLAICTPGNANSHLRRGDSYETILPIQ